MQKRHINSPYCESKGIFRFPSPQVSVGPFTIIKSIDALTESLADKISAEKRGFSISTKNIGNNTSINLC